MSEQQIIVADKAVLPVFQVSPHALQLRDDALGGSALIGKVENAEQNELAVRAHVALKQIAVTFEKARKALKEPLLEAGRQLDRAVNKELEEVEREIGRIKNLTDLFALAEQRRVREEEELQRRELERIERERQAELRRIQEEQWRIEREAREAREAAERAAAEAKNKAQREAAAKQLAEAEAKRKEAEKSAALVEEKKIAVEEKADFSARIESQPVQVTRAKGQVIGSDWDITVTNPYELAKFHPDCVKIEPLLSPIKAALNAGIAVKGVKAEKVIKSNVRAKALPNLIDV